MTERELPVVTLLTLHRYAGEYAVIEVRMQGDEVLSREVLEQSRRFETVWESFKEESALRFGRKDVQ